MKEELNLSSSNDEPDMVLGTGYFKIKYSPFPVTVYRRKQKTKHIITRQVTGALL